MWTAAPSSTQGSSDQARKMSPVCLDPLEDPAVGAAADALGRQQADPPRAPASTIARAFSCQ